MIVNKEALCYKQEKDKIRCYLCPHNCLISEGNTGICKVREVQWDNDKLKLFSINYGEITSIALDPIEKKPLYNFFPGNNILSIGSFGCNFRCSFCQNYSISQYKADSRYVSPEEMCDIILRTENSIGVAFTYNEPSIWYEYVFDVAKKLKKADKNKKVVLVTNGYINEEPLKELLPYIDAMNIDLKGNDEYYKKLCFGRMEPVKKSIKLACDNNCHVEVTTLLISGENSSLETIIEIGDFIAGIDKNIPLHISRYFPRYKMNAEMTNLDDMKNVYNTLKQKLNYVYLGNLNEEEYSYIINHITTL